MKLDTDAARSELMKRVKQRGTQVESTVGTALRRAGLSYRKNVRSLPGTPDFANRSKGWALFVNGCFWHRHTNCARSKIPTRNRDFWQEKFRANRRRDARKIRELRQLGLRVVVVWECEVRDPAALAARLSTRQVRAAKGDNK
jgi:DNA mismatch endonuclease (patch repair protein)